MQNYTHDLVTEEVGLNNLIENSLKAIEQEKEAIADAAKISEEDVNNAAEERLFNYSSSPIKDADFVEFNEFVDQEKEEDES